MGGFFGGGGIPSTILGVDGNTVTVVNSAVNTVLQSISMLSNQLISGNGIYFTFPFQIQNGTGADQDIILYPRLFDPATTDEMSMFGTSGGGFGMTLPGAVATMQGAFVGYMFNDNDNSLNFCELELCAVPISFQPGIMDAYTNLTGGFIVTVAAQLNVQLVSQFTTADPTLSITASSAVIQRL